MPRVAALGITWRETVLRNGREAITNPVRAGPATLGLRLPPGESCGYEVDVCVGGGYNHSRLYRESSIKDRASRIEHPESSIKVFE